MEKRGGVAREIAKIEKYNRAKLPEPSCPMCHAEYFFLRIKVTVGMLLSSSLS
jgi:hypothetical protein